MGLFTSASLDTFDHLLVDQLQDLYDAEQRLTKALPQMADAANNASLKSAFQEHLRQTENHVKRLEEAFRMLGQSAKGKTCDAMKGLISEGSEVVSGTGDPAVKDAALIAAAQRVEHYEIAGYGTVRAYAKVLGDVQAMKLLEQTLDEEGETDKKLTDLAESLINLQAAEPA